jgi:hypothetical protein
MKSKLLGWVFHAGAYHEPGKVLDLSEEQHASLAQHGMAEPHESDEPSAQAESDPVATDTTTNAAPEPAQDGASDPGDGQPPQTETKDAPAAAEAAQPQKGKRR